MAKLVWDQIGQKLYETGVRNCVLYPQAANGTYPQGVAWNGITSFQETPSGADSNPFYADDIKYLELRSAEEFGATIEAYMYPDEWAEMDGSAEVVAGVMIGQQPRKSFGICFRSVLGNDVSKENYGYKLHLIYNSTASPSERSYQTINDSPEPNTFSWEITSTPVNVTGYKPTCNITIDSTQVAADKLALLEDKLYGTENTDAMLPSPDEVIAILSGTSPSSSSSSSSST